MGGERPCVARLGGILPLVTSREPRDRDRLLIFIARLMYQSIQMQFATQPARRIFFACDHLALRDDYLPLS